MGVFTGYAEIQINLRISLIVAALSGRSTGKAIQSRDACVKRVRRSSSQNARQEFGNVGCMSAANRPQTERHQCEISATGVKQTNSHQTKCLRLARTDLERLEAVTLAQHTPYFMFDFGESSWRVSLCDVRSR
jgi:hypothetical protein